MKHFKQDGYMNLLSGLGAPGLDRTVTGGFASAGWSRYWSSRRQLADYGEVYCSNGLAQKIIDRPANDAFNRGVEIEGDDDGLIYDEYERLSVMTRMSDAIRWSRLYGGSALLLLAKDGGELTDPLNLDTLDEVSEIKVYDLTCIKSSGQYYTDVANPDTYGKLEYYTITSPGRQSFDVHESRLIPVGGDAIPSDRMNPFGINWGGRPVLEACMNDLMHYSQALEWALRLLERKQQAVYSMDGLGEMFANGDDAIVTNRINLVDQVRSILNSVVIDKNDAYSIQNLGLDGIQPLLDEYQVALSAASNIPGVILFGKSSQGLNATGEGDLENYYALVMNIQNVIAKPTLEKLTSILYVQKSLVGKIPDDWEIQFNPLWVPSGKEKALTDQAKTAADANTITNLMTLLNNGILSPEEVRQVVVNDIYNEHGFDDTLPSAGGDINYSEGVDVSMLDVPNPKQPQSEVKV